MKKIESFLKKISNKSVLVIYPHPDDESVMSGGLILKAQKMGFEVTVVVVTEGGRGRIFVHGGGRSMHEIRRSEMASAMSRLGVSDWVMWKFDDGRLKKTNLWKRRVKKIVETMNPGLLVSYDFSGVTGHPDHISLSREVFKISKLKGIPLLWSSFLGKHKDRMVERRVSDLLQNPEYFLELSFLEATKKWLAAFSHKSQNLVDYVRFPWWILCFIAREEWYYLSRPSKKYKYRYIRFRI